MNLAARLLLFIILATPHSLQGQRTARPERELAQTIWRELIAVKSVSGTPETRKAIAVAVKWLKWGGFPASDIHVGGPGPNAQALVVRYRGAGRADPIILMAHLDVVDARKSDWTTDPFTPVERDGWLYGRGSSDDKAGAAIILATALRLKQSGFIPSRDLLLVFTTDEETTSETIRWVANGPGKKLIGKPAFALNLDAGGGILINGRESMLMVQTSEKVYQTYRFTVRNRGGHSSLPRDDNAIYALARALTRLESFRFPVILNETTRTFFTRQAEVTSGWRSAAMKSLAANWSDTLAARQLSADPYYNALLRTTCIATRLEGGHADNALPQTAVATVNCRIFPGTKVDLVDSTLRAVVRDTAVQISRVGNATESPPSPVSPELFAVLQNASGKLWPGIPVVPEMAAGATDGLYLRNAGIPTYGVLAIFADPADSRAHGKDERVEIRRFDEAERQFKLLIEALAR